MADSPPISPSYVRLMARYGEWMNRNLFDAAGSLGDDDRRRGRGAFFGSIHATLSHILWGDMTWMHRLAAMPPAPVASIAESGGFEPDFGCLRALREDFDRRIVAWADRCTAADLAGTLTYFSGAAGRELSRPRWVLVAHLFNHATHHRGQVHAMLTAAGARPGDTDLPFMPDEILSAVLEPGRGAQR